MDPFSSLIPFLQGLAASSLIVLGLMLSNAASLFASLSTSAGNLASQQNEISFPAQAQSSPASTTPAKTPSSAAVAASNASTTAAKTPIPTKKPVPAVPVASASIAPSAPQTPLLSPEQVNENARASIVNILCLATGNGQENSISGSGVIIDARGVILTNAHVGQYFLLKDYP
ncbi:MAG TPA: hypothetical protein VN701_01580, partial [Candidatus Paceibacterota bacterium]|nr:hypothetical protein [Candidatus Paceibacterota bacterium]